MRVITYWKKTLEAFFRIDEWGNPRSKKNTFFVLMLTIFCLGLQPLLYSQNNIKGVAPLDDPNGGLAIDGNAYIGMPGDNPDAGDWLFPFGFETTDPANENPGAVFPPEASDAIATGIPDFPIPDEFYVFPGQTTFFRDNITNNDPTIFTSSNKINDNPNTYTWGTGSSPNKNEIQNAIAHFSFADPNLEFGVEGDLWLAFAADRQVTNGSSYIDFEILQAPLTLQAGGTVQSLGPDGGRTLGDILVTIEFTNGGGAAKVVTRRWVANGSGFIYQVFTPDAGTVFGTENDVMTIVPYSIYFQDPIEIDVDGDGELDEGFYQYSINQWAEGAVNISSFFPEDACITLSTLFVRTRTSGNSSQSELKDFPGPPIQIQIDLTPPAPELTDQAACDVWDETLEATGCEGTVKWYDVAEGGTPVHEGASFSPGEITETTSYWASCTVDECEGPRAMVTITIYESPDFDVTNLEDCEDAATGAQSFDLNDAISNEDAGTLTFYTSEANALVPQNAIGTPGSYSVNIGSETIWARLDNDNDGDEDCNTIQSFTVTVYDNPDIMVQDLEDCEDGTTGSQTFDLNDGVTDDDGGSVSFYTSEANALVPQNAIGTPGSYSVNIGSETIWVRSDNDSDGDEDCFSISSFDIDVYDNPDLQVQDLADCEDGTSGSQTFDLNDGVTDDDGGSVSFYTSEANALVPQNAIGTPGSYSVNIGSETIWVRSDNDSDGDEDCFSIASFDIDVYDNPDFDVEDLAACQASDVETADFNLNDAISNQDAGTLTFYNSEGDALVPQNAIADPTSVSVAQPGDTFWARLDNDNDGDETCFTILSFDVSVFDNPDLQVEDLADCEDGTTGSQTFDLNDGVTDAGGGTLSFYNSEGDALVPQNAIGTPGSYSVNIGSETIWVRSDNDSDGDEDCFSIASFDIDVYDNPDLQVQDLEDCEDGTTGSQSFNLNDAVTDADSGSVSFYTSETDALVPQNAIGTPASYSVNIGSETIWARSDNDNDGDEDCFSIASFDIDVYDNPDLQVEDLADCEDGVTGSQTFDLNDGVTDDDGGSVSFYTSEGDALVPQNAIGTPGSYSVNIGSETIWVRSDNDSAGDEDCFGIASFSITVYDNPDVTATDPDAICLGESVDLALFVSADGGTLSFHLSQADADTDMNALASSVVSPGLGVTMYFVRSETINGDDICFGTAVINVTVEQCVEEGCTLGYWKNHTDRWCDAYITCDLYGDIFEDAPAELADLTLLEVLNLGGGGIYNLGRQSVAALLNTCSSEVDFSYSDVEDLISDVNDAFVNGQAGSFGNELDLQNQAGCPLGGTNATTEPSDECGVSVTSSAEISTSSISIAPVPFKETVNIRYDFEYTSDVKIEFYDLNSRLLRTYVDKQVSSGDETQINVDFALNANQVYILRVVTDRESFSKSIISGK